MRKRKIPGHELAGNLYKKTFMKRKAEEIMRKDDIKVPDFSGSTGHGHKVPGKMPTRKEALERFFKVWNPETHKETVPIGEALGRVTAEDIFSNVTLPVKRTAGLDGIAVRSSDFAGGKMPDVSMWKAGKDYVFADTGDDFPDEFDAIIMVEWLSLREDGTLKAIHLPNPDDPGYKGHGPFAPKKGGPVIGPGSYTRPAGSIIRKGGLLMRKNERIRATDLAALAMGNVVEVPVQRKPVIAFIPTGSELVAPGSKVTRGNNIDTNSLLISHMAKEMGASVITYPILRDERENLRNMLKKALQEADIVLINGGSSKGTEDYNIRLIEEMGDVIVHNVAAVPGRPVALALVDGKAVIDLPGPTLAAYFVSDWCVRSLVARYLHQKPDEKETVTGILKGDIPKGGPVEIIHRLNVRLEDDGTYAIYPLQRDKASSADVMNSNAQYVTGLFEESHPKGSALRVELLRNRGNL